MNNSLYISPVNFLRMMILTVNFVAVSFPASSQTEKYSHASIAEKIYLQLDNKIYTTDNAIWFKAIVVNAMDHVPTTLSGVLYVELIGPDERIIEKKLIKIDHGIGEGFFDLNQRYSEGVYQIRAYTEWNKNFGEDFFFKEYIRVFAPSKKEKTEPISKIVLTENSNKERRINALFDPIVIDSLHKKDLTLFVTFDNKKDSFLVKKNSKDKYLFDYPVPEGCQFVTLQIQTKNQMSHSKTIALDENRLDLQFFPESGEMVHGLPAKIAFKALDCNGKGKAVEGEIINQRDEVITVFKSNQLGMGSFVLSSVDSSTVYAARLKSAGEALLHRYPLPPIAKSGNSLSVKKTINEIRITALSNYLKNDSICFRVSCRGVVYFEINECLRNGKRMFLISPEKLPEGIIAFTLTDQQKRPLAERLYFNERPESRINIKLSADKELYSTREMTKLGIEASNSEGEGVNASLSLLVLNKDQLGPMQSTRQNILSWFLLSSDLKGEIEKPGFYFSQDQDRHDDLDALMLTQGWRKYNYTKPPETIRFLPEPKLTISGKVSGAIFPKSKKGVELTMMTFGKSGSFFNQKTDSLGRFNFDLDDEYGQNLNILIQSSNKSGEKKNYKIALDKKESPAISFNHARSIEKPDSVVKVFVAKNIERKSVEDALKMSAGTILLNEVVVEGTQMTPEKKKVTEEYGKPKVVISGKAIQDKEQKWSYGLYSVLMFNFPDQIDIIRARNGNLFARVKSNDEITLVVIDGIPAIYYEYPLIPNIPPSEVKSLEIIPYASNFRDLYLRTFPNLTPMQALNAPFWGNVIAIYTHGGKGIYGANQPEGIMKTSVPVFSASREFYAPKYENPNEWVRPDLRALIHWAPNLRTDSLGKASATFYNADNTGEMKVVVEAISENGEIGYQEFDYKVMKRNDKNE